MPELWKHLFLSDGVMPPGHGYLWQPELVWLHVVSDAVVALAYLSIPFALLHVVRKRRDLPFHWMFLCSGLFIIACGASHVMQIWTLWTPLYRVSGVIKAITALAALPTAVLLIKLVPRALATPAPQQLAQPHDELPQADETLERRVAERTDELTRKNEALAKLLAEHHRADVTLTGEGQLRKLALLDAAPDAMVIVDHEGRIVLVNAETEELFGYPRAKLLGQLVDVLVPERFRAAHAGHRAAYFGGPTGRRAMGAGQQLIALRSDGREFPAEIRLSPIETDDGLLVSSAIRDVTERLRTEQALRRTKEAAEAANAELEAFSYSVAHDLRTPLRAMGGYSENLLEDCGDKLGDEARAQLTRIVAGARHMSELIDALLTLARLTRTEPQREQVDLTALAHAIIDQLRATQPDRTVELVVADDLIVHGDPRMLRLVLDNLLGNAWKFTGRQPAARIELGREQRDGTTVYYVRDNGAGFDMSLADKLFTPFRRLHLASEFEGSGIGLATVQRIIRRHGGRVWAEGAEGAEAHGATFRFTLSSDASPAGAAWSSAP